MAIAAHGWARATGHVVYAASGIGLSGVRVQILGQPITVLTDS